MVKILKNVIFHYGKVPKNISILCLMVYNDYVRGNRQMKNIRAIMFSIVGLFSLCSSSVFQEGKLNDIKPSVFHSKANHPSITGFQYVDGTDRQLVTDSVGYFYYELEYYYTQFTDVSRLYLLHVNASFTPGSLASKNDEKNYDKHYDLLEGSIDVTPYQKTENSFKKSSTFVHCVSWPYSKSNPMTCNVQSQFNNHSLLLSEEIKAGTSFPEGAKVISKTYNGFKLEFTDVANLHDKPSITHERDLIYKEKQSWNYSFGDAYSSSYFMDCFYLREVKNDAVVYQNYSFGFQVDIKMTNTAWEKFAWRKHHDVTKSAYILCGC